jgi:hypothetical protein
MPTEAEIDRLQGLIAQLAPLAKRASGDLIKSADWDLVVDSLIAVARAQVSEQVEPVKPHEHSEQVSIGWLDPKLRQLVEGGPLADPAQVARLGDVERRAERLEATQTGFTDETKQIRELVHEVSSRDLERQAAMTELRRIVENLANAKDDVVAVRATLRALDEKVRNAVEIGAALSVDGSTVDMTDVVKRIGVVEELRSRLTLPTGEVLDAAEFQKQLSKLRNEMATQQDIDEALKLRPVELPEESRAALETDLGTRFTAELATANASLKEEIAQSTDEKLGQVDAKVAQAVSDATPTITAGVVDTLRPEITAAADGAVTQAADAAAKLVGTSESSLRDELTTTIKELSGALPDLIATDLNRRLGDVIAPIEASIKTLDQSLDSITVALKTVDGQIGGLSARIETVAAADADAIATLEKSLTGYVDTQLEEVRRRVGFAELELTKYVDASIADASSELLAQTKVLVSDEVAALNDKLPSLIDTQLAISRTTTTAPVTTTEPTIATSPTISPTTRLIR